MRTELSRALFVPVICLIIAGYFVYHSVQGAHGYRRMRQIEAEIASDRQTAEEIHKRKELLAHKVRALSSGSLDLDLLEETSTRILNMGSAEDRIILLPDDNRQSP